MKISELLLSSKLSSRVDLPEFVLSARSNSNSIFLDWSAISDEYTVWYKNVSSDGLISEVSPDSTYVITGLLPESAYDVYVSTVIGGIYVESNTVRVETSEAPLLARSYPLQVVSRPIVTSKSDFTDNPDRDMLLPKSKWDRIKQIKGSSKWSSEWQKIVTRSNGGTADIIAKAIVYKVEGNASKGIDALERAYSWVNTITDYEKSKDPLNVLSQCLIVYKLCYDLFDFVNFSRSQFRDRVFDKYTAIPGNSTNFRNTRSFIAGHQATGFLQRATILSAFWDDEPGVVSDILDSLFADGGLEATNYFLRSSAAHQGTYGGKEGHYFLWHLLLNQFVDPSKTVVDDNVRFLTYSIMFGHRSDGVSLVDGETNDQQWGRAHSLYYSLALGLLAFGDPHLLYFMYNHSFDNPVRGLAQEEATETIIALSRLAYEIDPIPLEGNVSRVYRASYPLNRVIWKSNHTLSGNQTIVDFKGNALSTESHDDRAEGRINVYHKKNPLITIGGVWSGVFDLHSRNWIRQVTGAGGIVLYDSAEDWTNNGASSNHINTGGLRSNATLEGQLYKLNTALNSSNGWFINDWQGDFTDSYTDPSIINASTNMTKGYRIDGVNTSMYRNRANHVKRYMTVFTKIPGYGCVILLMDKVNHLSNVDDFQIRFPVQNYSNSGNRSFISKGSSGMQLYSVGNQLFNLTGDAGFQWKGRNLFYDSGDVVNDDTGNGEVVIIKSDGLHPNQDHHVATAMLVGDSSQSWAPISGFIKTETGDQVRFYNQSLKIMAVYAKGSLEFGAGLTVNVPSGINNIIINDVRAGRYTVNQETYDVSELERCIHLRSGSSGVYTIRPS